MPHTPDSEHQIQQIQTHAQHLLNDHVLPLWGSKRAPKGALVGPCRWGFAVLCSAASMHSSTVLVYASSYVCAPCLGTSQIFTARHDSEGGWSAAALVLVGSLMLINVVKIKWGNVNEAVPAFLTIIVMPMTYSIAYGALNSHRELYLSIFCHPKVPVA